MSEDGFEEAISPGFNLSDALWDAPHPHGSGFNVSQSLAAREAGAGASRCAGAGESRSRGNPWTPQAAQQPAWAPRRRQETLLRSTYSIVQPSLLSPRIHDAQRSINKAFCSVR